ncbi:MAG: SixA phosphatase family protein [Myxococcota bacterium]
MKRHLLLIRHAKAGPKGPGIDDHGRTLADRGRADSLRVAAKIKELGWVPERALVSDAMRTRETWELMEEVFDTSVPTDDLPDLYLGDVDDICEALFTLDDDVKSVAVVGHNPGWSEAVRWFSGVSVRMKTCNVALLKADVDSWSESCRKNGWGFEELLRPTDI